MKSEKIKLSELIPSEYNPRVMSKEEHKQLQTNLKQFGLVDPIIINLKNYHIIGGHQRYSVLIEKYGGDTDFKDAQLNIIKLGDIGWVFEDENLKIKDENHEKALNLALNKISGEWDYGKLSDILDDLNKTHFDMDLTGFDKLEVEQFIIPEDLTSSFEEIIEQSNKSNNNDTVTRENENTITNNTEEQIEPINPIEEDNNFTEEENYDDTDEYENEITPEEIIEEKTKYRCPKCGYEW